MPIIIPSKRIYDISSSIVNKNVISSVEFEVSKFTERSSVSSLKKITEDVSEIATFPPIIPYSENNQYDSIAVDLSEYQVFQQVETIPNSSPVQRYISVAGIKPIYKEYSFTIATQITNNSFASYMSNDPISIVVNKTIELRERDFSVHIEGTTIQTSQIDGDYETTDGKYSSLEKPKRVTNATIPYSGVVSGLTSEGEKTAILNWSIYQTNDEYYQILENELPNIEVEKVLLEDGTPLAILVKIRVLCGASIFEGTSDKYSARTDVVTKLVEYRPESLTITINGTTYELITEKKTLVKTSPYISKGERISVKNNSLIQSESIISSKTEELLLAYSKGKETAKVRCSIGEYADENGNLVISTKTPDKMLFEHYDKVVPLVKVGKRQELAMSYTADGLAKVFDVVGVRVFFDGAVWQELTLRESGESIDLGRTTYTTIGNKAGGLTYKITSNQIRTEVNSARGITYIIGE